MEWMIKVFLEGIYAYLYYVSPLIKARLNLVRNTAAEKEFDITIQMTLKCVNSEIQENRNSRK